MGVRGGPWIDETEVSSQGLHGDAWGREADGFVAMGQGPQM